jgi:hypothetical protein
MLSLGNFCIFVSWESGDDALPVGSNVVAERRRECDELPESIDDKLVDFRCDVRWGLCSILSRLLSFGLGCSAIDIDVGTVDGRMPNICDAPLL